MCKKLNQNLNLAVHQQTCYKENAPAGKSPQNQVTTNQSPEYQASESMQSPGDKTGTRISEKEFPAFKTPFPYVPSETSTDYRRNVDNNPSSNAHEELKKIIATDSLDPDLLPENDLASETNGPEDAAPDEQVPEYKVVEDQKGLEDRQSRFLKNEDSPEEQPAVEVMHNVKKHAKETIKDQKQSEEKVKASKSPEIPTLSSINSSHKKIGPIRISDRFSSSKLNHALELRCKLCQKKFRTPRDLKKHFTTEHTKAQFDNHTETVHICKNYGICGKSLKNRRHKKEHVEGVGEVKKHFCETCSKGLGRKKHLLNHITTVHKISGNFTFAKYEENT